MGTLLLLAAAGGWLWHWAGSEGSLASTLGWAGTHWPLSSQQVSGSLLHGGTAQQLVWQQDGLRVQVDGVTLRWTPADLLRRTLHIQQLAARRVQIDDQRPPSPPASAPPATLALPLHVRIDALRVDELAWADLPTQALHDLAGRYAFDGARHTLDLTHARFEGGRYQARATLAARAPMALELVLAGALSAEAPGAGAPAALTLQARVHGPLAHLQAQAVAQAAADAATPTLPALPSASIPLALPQDTNAPRAQLSARITPWAAQPLPEAHAQLQALDLRAFWPRAPHTLLSGTAELTPLPGTAGWHLNADLRNARAGPWDRQRLPVEALQAAGQWQAGAATIDTLQANVAGGTLQASGRWSPAADARWQVDVRATDVDPARLHSPLAASPVSGTARIEGLGSALDFNLALQARAQANARAAPASAMQALRSADARGRWAEGWLTLQQLDVRAADARLAGTARLHLANPRTPSGSADLRLSAPGLQASVQGDLAGTRGQGKAQIELSDAARTLAWAQTLPGAAPLLAGAQARGSATLQATWSGGWHDPEVHARLNAPKLQAQRTDDAAPWQLQGAELTLDGRLAQAQLSMRGQLHQAQRQIELQAAAELARTTAQPTLAASTWRVQVQQLQAQLRDPALGAGAWRLASAQPFTLQGVPRARGPLHLSAGTLTLTSPAPTQQARLDWDPLRWQAGALRSSGRLTGLPLQWAERLSGVNLADSGIEGALLFNGHWDLDWDDQLRLRAELARASGDLSLVARDTDTGLSTRVPAGLRQARLQLASDGPAVTAQLQWDSAEAGQVQGSLRTQLAATPDGEGGTRWSWPATAPLSGQLQAQLPRIAAWSALAPPGWRLRGSLAADVRVAGTRAQPQLSGTLSADDLALRSVVDGFALGRGRLRARLEGTQLHIDELLLHGPGTGDAGGTLRATGQAGWQAGHAQARLHVTLARLHASVRADRDITVSGQVQAALDGRQVTVGGGLRVDRGRIELPDDSAPSLGSDVVVHGAPTAATPTAPAAPPPSPPISPLTVDAKLQLDLGDDLRVRGQGLDTRLAGRLQLSAQGPIGTPPQLTGTIRTEGGRFQAYSQNLDITRGAITFTGAVDNPSLDIIALRPIFTSDQRVGVQVAGSALLPRVRLYSDPALPDSQALAWLLLGRAAPATGAESAMLQSAAVALLGGREGRGLAARLGLDELSFSRGSEGANGSDGSVGGASVTLGKRLSQRLYAAYQHSLAGTSGALLIFYELSRRWSLRAQAGENAALDLIYRLSFD